MNILKSLAQAFGGAPRTAADPGLYYYVKCARCGEVIQVRLNRNNDLSVEYAGSGSKNDTYIAHKMIVGKQCYNRIEAHFSFTSNRQLIEKKIEGGSFVDRSDYDSYQEKIASTTRDSA